MALFKFCFGEDQYISAQIPITFLKNTPCMLADLWSVSGNADIEIDFTGRFSKAAVQVMVEYIDSECTVLHCPVDYNMEVMNLLDFVGLEKGARWLATTTCDKSMTETVITNILNAFPDILSTKTVYDTDIMTNVIEGIINMTDESRRVCAASALVEYICEKRPDRALEGSLTSPFRYTCPSGISQVILNLCDVPQTTTAGWVIAGGCATSSLFGVPSNGGDIDIYIWGVDRAQRSAMFHKVLAAIDPCWTINRTFLTTVVRGCDNRSIDIIVIKQPYEVEDHAVHSIFCSFDLDFVMTAFNQTSAWICAASALANITKTVNFRSHQATKPSRVQKATRKGFAISPAIAVQVIKDEDPMAGQLWYKPSSEESPERIRFMFASVFRVDFDQVTNGASNTEPGEMSLIDLPTSYGKYAAVRVPDVVQAVETCITENALVPCSHNKKVFFLRMSPQVAIDIRLSEANIFYNSPPTTLSIRKTEPSLATLLVQLKAARIMYEGMSLEFERDYCEFWNVNVHTKHIHVWSKAEKVYLKQPLHKNMQRAFVSDVTVRLKPRHLIKWRKSVSGEFRFACVGIWCQDIQYDP